MVEARNFDDGRVSYVENNSMSNSLALSVDQNMDRILSYIFAIIRKETSIHEGDIVITSGNLNLADGTEVKLNNKE